jgi:GH15 family glucan-1,4-alpha-glucosidase
MPSRIEDYAIIGDHHSAALVAKDGSIDWLCLPRFDSGACFAALLGTPDHGRWQIAPAGGVERITRRYRPGTLILETEFHTADGAVRVTDCMPVRDREANVVRLVEGIHGRVPMRMELVIRFDYGSIVPWVRSHGAHLTAIAGPDALHLHAGVKAHGEDFKTVADFEVSKGERVPFVLTWHPSNEPNPRSLDARDAIDQTQAHWEEWTARREPTEEWDDAILRSLITLKALTYSPTGGIVAAATTSLPEQLGGVRNWDYRYCWLRDATFTLFSLLSAGFEEEARAWRTWLLRAIAGKPEELQIVYGPAGERRLTELELDWLPGYERSAPVRIGNAASRQFQLDVYGEVVDLLHQARTLDFATDQEEAVWAVELAVLDFLESDWDQPDEGIWEVRGPRRHFTHSKVMVWVALDRAVNDVEHYGLAGPVDRWRALRQEVHDQVCREGFDAERGTFVQSYGSNELDANLLLIPLVGFLPADDQRVRGTVEAIRHELVSDGFVMRYRGNEEVDGLPPGEGAFLPCTFWLADALALMGRAREAREIFERLLAIRNDVGLLAEEYDPRSKRHLGNFPQAFSHVSLVNTARNLSDHTGPARRRSGGRGRH